jgi:DNA-binding NtrC family response regulator
MEYAWIVSGGQPIMPVHLPHDVRSARSTTAYLPSAPPTVPFPRPIPTLTPPNTTKSLSDVEMEYILQVYAKNNGNKQTTAAELGISLKTLYNKLHKYEEERSMRAG